MSYRGALGHAGTIPIHKNNKQEYVRWVIQRILDVFENDIDTQNEECLEADMKFAFDDIEQATKIYLGEDTKYFKK